MIIDTHAHLYLEEFNDDIEEITAAAINKGISKVLLPNIDLSTVEALTTLANRWPDMYKPMIGLHPCYVKEDYEAQLDQLFTYFENTQTVAVGEIGIDLYWDRTFEAEQIIAFKRQIEWAKELDLPIVIHSRDSLDITIGIVEEMQSGALRGVFHCFNGDIVQSQRIIDVGFYMGIGGVVTYKNAGVDKVVKDIDLDYLVLETDAPYLSPVPYRGKRNESAYIIEVLDKIAVTKGIAVKEVEERTTNNARNLFRV